MGELTGEGGEGEGEGEGEGRGAGGTAVRRKGGRGAMRRLLGKLSLGCSVRLFSIRDCCLVRAVCRKKEGEEKRREEGEKKKKKKNEKRRKIKWKFSKPKNLWGEQ
jgi:hypothetical protein